MSLPRVLGTVWQDLRYGVRTLRSNPAFAATAMLSLALGIGANAALFQLVNALLLRSLPVSKPQDLVSIGWKGDANRKGYFWSGPNDFTYPLWEQVRANHAPFTGVLAWANARFNLATAGTRVQSRESTSAAVIFACWVCPRLSAEFSPNRMTVPPAAPPGPCWAKHSGGASTAATCPRSGARSLSTATPSTSY